MEKVMAVYWFVILIIVAGGVFGMVYSFYTHPYDVRDAEGQIFINQISDCLSTAGKLNPLLFDSNGFSKSFGENFTKICHINLNVEDTWTSPQYFVLVDFADADSGKTVFNVTEGDPALEADCNIQKTKTYELETKCVSGSFFSLKGDKLYLIKTLVAIRKSEKNVKEN